MPAILITVHNKQRSIWIYCHTEAAEYNIYWQNCSNSTAKVLFILFTHHLFTKWHATETAKCCCLDYASQHRMWLAVTAKPHSDSSREIFFTRVESLKRARKRTHNFLPL